MIGLLQFLLARIAEDDANAADCGGGAGCEVPDAIVDRNVAECEARQAILGEHAAEDRGNGVTVCRVCDWNGGDGYPCRTLEFLALPYADHPDYREEWKP